jgi:hypothetical protein
MWRELGFVAKAYAFFTLSNICPMAVWSSVHTRVVFPSIRAAFDKETSGGR